MVSQISSMTEKHEAEPMLFVKQSGFGFLGNPNCPRPPTNVNQSIIVSSKFFDGLEDIGVGEHYYTHKVYSILFH